MSDSEGAWSCSNNDADGSCDSRDGALCIFSSLEWLPAVTGSHCMPQQLAHILQATDISAEVCY